MSTFLYEKDEAGIVTVTMDMEGPVNTMNAAFRTLMKDTVDKLEQEHGLTGVVIASAKTTFFAGGDLKEMLATQPDQVEQLFEQVELTKLQLRRLEKLQVPVVAAINGAALGGGYEICLACNYRILLNNPSVIIGLPEVSLGLLPGGGGTVRLVHRLGLQAALPYLTEGKRLRPDKALANNLVEQLEGDKEQLVPAAKQWIKANPDAWQQPWDMKGHVVPGGGIADKDVQQLLQVAPALLRKTTRGLLPSPAAILSVAAETMTVDFDTALRVETRHFLQLVLGPVAKNIISTLFFQLNDINGGASRPKSVAQKKVKKLGILGAGMMGQGIAYCAASAGIEVVLKDISIEAAEKGKTYSHKLLAKRVARGHMDQAKMDGILARIKPSENYQDLQGCDLIIEAVFENIELKAKVTQEAEPLLANGGVFGSNTSTLPITKLAEASNKPENFIGIHFFSPVDKMPLIEIICGDKTSDEALALAFDFARQINKTAIVVNDVLGFFTSRVFGTFMDEGARLLQEGVNPILIERMGQAVGMPVGPLAVHDEVSQKLTHSAAQTQRDMGMDCSISDVTVLDVLSVTLIEQYGRGGRAHGGGYYEYPEDGEKHLWPKLFELFHKPEVELAEDDIKDRLLFRQVIESLKCLQEGVLRSVADGNVGSIMGIGAPVWTGGFLQFINTYGARNFVDRSTELAAKYGDRFIPPANVVEAAKNGSTFN
ncbi:3-hydroxyacyl-CoA dehydrogenase NAD-binding domain-containing protein [Oceanicoccus sp. KOV_DT_Chl]|uniref:3-hydroxyacyl-CoA dehydrogenase NAD-binding domain-containing protein n=1 Tax=Oceanicoccus sp. KOV_DT_Chl TaxID=1904639 RepID=UPI000C7DBDA7|nr:3-hydroxyacyl-CoA dehydrogenase NAD-binding domain-containing protein [Oceanicoccus sp. KOV_DT_Chl]